MDPAEAERTRRLAVMQMQDLGLARASYITGVDTRGNTRPVDLAELERARAANTPGTREHADAQKHRASLNAWASAFKVLEHDGADDGKEDMGGGQVHRGELLRRQAEERARLASRDNSGRGGRTRGGGRGGGVIGTRGRGDRVLSSTREVSVLPPAPPTSRRQPSTGRGRMRSQELQMSSPELPSPRRPSPASRAAREGPRRQPPHLRWTAELSSTSKHVGVQRTVPREVFGGGFQLASPSEFMAVAGRSTPISSSSSHNLPSSTQPLASTPSRKPKERFASMAPLVTTNIPAIVEPEVTFSPEIDSAPEGLRVQTPPPARHASYQKHLRTSYSNDLQGLDLSPEIPQDVEDQMTDRLVEAMEIGEGNRHHGIRDAPTKLAQDHAGVPRQSNRMPRVPTTAPHHNISTEQIESDSYNSTLFVNSQAVLDRLLKLNLSPSVANSITELQATLHAEQLKQVSTGVQSHPKISTEQPTVATGIGKTEEELRKSVVDRTTNITNILKQNQTQFTQNLSLPNSEFIRKQFPSTTLPRTYTVSTARTLLEPGHETLVNRVRDAIPIAGTLQDSEHSVETFHPRSKLIHRDRESAAIIGEHILPNGWMRKHDASQSPVIDTIASQATIRHDTGGAKIKTSAVPSQPRTSALDIDAVNQRLSQSQLRTDVQHPNIGGSSSTRILEQSAQHNQSLGRAYGVSELLASKPGNVSASAAKPSDSHEYQTQFRKEWADATSKLKEETNAKEIAALKERIQRMEQSMTYVAQYTSRPITITASAQASSPIPAPAPASAQAPASAASISSPAMKLRMRDVPYIPDNASAYQYSHQYSRSEQQNTYSATSTNLTRGLDVRGSAATSGSKTIISTEPSTPKRNTFVGNDTIKSSGQTIATPAAVISPIRGTVKGRGPTRAFEPDATASSWDPTPEVRITVSPTRARAPTTRAQDQVIGGSIGASMWSSTGSTHGLGVSLGEPPQTLTEVTRDSFNRGRAPTKDARPARLSRAVPPTDPGIGDTSTLFARYSRPTGGYQVPAFIAAGAAARRAADPGAAVRAQYGLASLPVAGSSSHENRPIRKSKLEKVELEKGGER